jgi:hypothetical protein
MGEVMSANLGGGHTILPLNTSKIQILSIKTCLCTPMDCEESKNNKIRLVNSIGMGEVMPAKIV